MAKRRLLAVGLALAIIGGASACGVTTSSQPEDIGTAYAAGSTVGDSALTPPRFDEANVPQELVTDYLKAAAGGGDGAISRLREYLSSKSKVQLPDPAKSSQLTIIRADPPSLNTTSGVVTVTYRIVGTLNGELGRMEVPSYSPVQQMKFAVVPRGDGKTLAIESIEGAPDGGPLLLDEALTDFYRIQPIYFWDQTNTRLIPDLRYLPLTQNQDARATTILRWLFGTPSGWLIPTAQQVAEDTALKTSAVTDGGSLIVNLTAQAGAKGPDVLTRLFYQIQWSLRPCGAWACTAGPPPIKLRIEGKDEAAPPSDSAYQAFNLALGLGGADRRTFDIADKKVGVPEATTQPDILNKPDNANVESAAVNRGADLAAFVTVAEGRKTLHIVGSGQQPLLELFRRTDILRPVWIPGTTQLLVIVDKRLYVVGLNGQPTELLPGGGFTSVAVAPDGRRIAYVQNHQAFATALKVDGEKVSIETQPRAILPGLIDATALTWTGEAWLYVVGGSQAAPQVWRTTVDSVLAKDLSKAVRDSTAVPYDVVALATNATSRPGEVYMLTTQGTTYSIASDSVTPVSLKKPFFVS
jgi:hypothetical protein